MIFLEYLLLLNYPLHKFLIVFLSNIMIIYIFYFLLFIYIYIYIYIVKNTYIVYLKK